LQTAARVSIPPHKQRLRPINGHSTITIDGLRKSYDRLWAEPVLAVDDVSFSVERGTIVGLIGPNGAGKSTLIQCLLGLLIPDEGTLSIFGQSPRTKAVKKQLGYLSEDFRTYDFLTPVNVLRFFGGLSGVPEAPLEDRIEDVLRAFGLADAAENNVGSFSKGMNQRLGMAQALLHDPELLVLDEPFTGLDPEGRRTIIDVLLEKKEEGKTIFFSSHILADIERVCDRVLIIDRGDVIRSGTLDDLLRLQHETLEDFYMEIVPSIGA